MIQLVQSTLTSTTNGRCDLNTDLPHDLQNLNIEFARETFSMKRSTSEAMSDKLLQKNSVRCLSESSDSLPHLALADVLGSSLMQGDYSPESEELVLNHQSDSFVVARGEESLVFADESHHSAGVLCSSSISAAELHQLAEVTSYNQPLQSPTVNQSNQHEIVVPVSSVASSYLAYGNGAVSVLIDARAGREYSPLPSPALMQQHHYLPANTPESPQFHQHYNGQQSPLACSGVQPSPLLNTNLSNKNNHNSQQHLQQPEQKHQLQHQSRHLGLYNNRLGISPLSSSPAMMAVDDQVHHNYHHQQQQQHQFFSQSAGSIISDSNTNSLHLPRSSPAIPQHLTTQIFGANAATSLSGEVGSSQRACVEMKCSPSSSPSVDYQPTYTPLVTSQLTSPSIEENHEIIDGDVVLNGSSWAHRNFVECPSKSWRTVQTQQQQHFQQPTVQQVQPRPNSQHVQRKLDAQETLTNTCESDVVFLAPSLATEASYNRINRKCSPSRKVPSLLNTPLAANGHFFQSNLRSPALQDPSTQGGGSRLTPAYTAPPMLPPSRPGTGLYWSLLTQSTSSQHHPVSRLHGECGSAEVLDYVSELPPETDVKPHPNIGPSYQADIPMCVHEAPAGSILEASIHRADLLWHPLIEEQLPPRQLDLYVEFCRCSSYPGGGRNEEYSLCLLHMNGGNIKEAMLQLMQPTQTLSSDHPLMDFVTLDNQRWSSREMHMFHHALVKYGKHFRSISKEMGTRTDKECVKFYYYWKKIRSADYHQIRTLRNQNEHHFPFSVHPPPVHYPPPQSPMVDPAYHHHHVQTVHSQPPIQQVTGDGETAVVVAGSHHLLHNYQQHHLSHHLQQPPQQPHHYHHLYQRHQNPAMQFDSAEGQQPFHGDFIDTRFPQQNSGGVRPLNAAQMRLHQRVRKQQRSPTPDKRYLSPSVSSPCSSQGDSTEEYPCKLCGKVFHKVKSRNAHMKSHRPADSEPRRKTAHSRLHHSTSASSLHHPRSRVSNKIATHRGASTAVPVSGGTGAVLPNMNCIESPPLLSMTNPGYMLPNV